MADTHQAADLADALSNRIKRYLASITEPKPFGKLLLAIDVYTGTPSVIHALEAGFLVDCASY